MNKYISISDSLALSERNKASASLETIIEKKDRVYTKKYSFILQLSSVILIIIITFSFLFWRQKNKKIHSNYLAVIEKIKNDKNSEPQEVQTSYNERVNTFNIPEETYQKILAKMRTFEKNLGFLKKDITISYLSNQFKTNPKSLSSVINSSTDKNFNTYLNDLRINYITQKLYDNRI